MTQAKAKAAAAFAARLVRCPAQEADGCAPKVQEALINSLGNFMMAVNGVRLHFVHERSPHPGAIPLLFLHGWPGSFFEAHKLIRKLTMPGRAYLLGSLN